MYERITHIGYLHPKYSEVDRDELETAPNSQVRSVPKEPGEPHRTNLIRISIYSFM